MINPRKEAKTCKQYNLPPWNRKWALKIRIHLRQEKRTLVLPERKWKGAFMCSPRKLFFTHSLSLSTFQCCSMLTMLPSSNHSAQANPSAHFDAEHSYVFSKAGKEERHTPQAVSASGLSPTLRASTSKASVMRDLPPGQKTAGLTPDWEVSQIPGRLHCSPWLLYLIQGSCCSSVQRTLHIELACWFVTLQGQRKQLGLHSQSAILPQS